MIIAERKIIELTAQQELMIKSGWGEQTLAQTVTEEIVYRSLNGYKVKGYLSYPRTIVAGTKLPVLIWNRGGMKSAGYIDSFLARGMFGIMAAQGYVVLASMYGGSIKGEGEDEFGGREVNDILTLPLIARELDFADDSKIGIEGWSRGGMMTYLALQEGIKVKCAVTIGAITDLRSYNSPNGNFRAGLLAKFGAQGIEAAIEKRSAVLHTERFPGNIPLLLLHGKNDEVVSCTQSEQLAAKLKAAKIPFELVLIEGGDHYLRKHRAEIDKHRFAWFKKYLQV